MPMTNPVMVTVRPALINIWFHALFTRPGIVVGERAIALKWGTNDVDVPLGGDRIGVYFSYRGRPHQRLALTEAVLDVRDTERIHARLGVQNSARFTITVRGRNTDAE